MSECSFTFGKHRGRTFHDVLQNEPAWVAWALSLQGKETGKLKEFVAFARDKVAGKPHPIDSGSCRTMFQTTSSIMAGLHHQQPISQIHCQSSRPPPGCFLSQMSTPSAMPDRPPAVPAQGPDSRSGVAEVSNTSFALALVLCAGGSFQLVARPAKSIPFTVQKEIDTWNGIFSETTLHLCWEFNVSLYWKILGKLRSPALSRFLVEPVPPWVIKAVIRVQHSQMVKDCAESWLNDCLRELPSHIQIETPIMDFQKKGIVFGLTRAGRCLLADEMGLGKTLQALFISAHFRDKWPLLVVAPALMQMVWREEALRWLSHVVKASAVQVVSHAKQFLSLSSNIVIISYDLLVRNDRFQKRADGHPYNIVIFDESHMLKQWKAKRTRVCVKLAREAGHCILISGTPALNRAAELHPQLCMLLPEVPKFAQFCDRFCPQQKAKFPIWSGNAHAEELNSLLVGTVMMRRLKKDVLHELPSKRRQRVTLNPVKLKAEKLKVLKESLASGKPIPNSTLENPSKNMMELFKLTAETKIESVAEYVELLLQNGAKFLLFAHHHVMMDALEAQIAALQVSYIRIDGTTPQTSRSPLVQSFQEKADIRVALLSITVCGQGITLTAADTVVFAELHWVPGKMMQAEDRAHRIGQHHCVNVHYCIAEHTLDDLLYQLLEKKQRQNSEVLDGSVIGMEMKGFEINRRADLKNSEGLCHSYPSLETFNMSQRKETHSSDCTINAHKHSAPQLARSTMSLGSTEYSQSQGKIDSKTSPPTSLHNRHEERLQERLRLSQSELDSDYYIPNGKMDRILEAWAPRSKTSDDWRPARVGSADFAKRQKTNLDSLQPQTANIFSAPAGSNIEELGMLEQKGNWSQQSRQISKHDIAIGNKRPLQDSQQSKHVINQRMPQRGSRHAMLKQPLGKQESRWHGDSLSEMRCFDHENDLLEGSSECKFLPPRQSIASCDSERKVAACALQPRRLRSRSLSSLRRDAKAISPDYNSRDAGNSMGLELAPATTSLAKQAPLLFARSFSRRASRLP